MPDGRLAIQFTLLLLRDWLAAFLLGVDVSSSTLWLQIAGKC